MGGLAGGSLGGGAAAAVAAASASAENACLVSGRLHACRQGPIPLQPGHPRWQTSCPAEQAALPAAEQPWMRSQGCAPPTSTLPAWIWRITACRMPSRSSAAISSGLGSLQDNKGERPRAGLRRRGAELQTRVRGGRSCWECWGPLVGAVQPGVWGAPAPCSGWQAPLPRARQPACPLPPPEAAVGAQHGGQDAVGGCALQALGQRAVVAQVLSGGGKNRKGGTEKEGQHWQRGS